MPHVSQLRSLLDALDARGLLRRPDDGGVRASLAETFGEDFLDASSNDYLALGRVVSRETGEGDDEGPLSAPAESETMIAIRPLSTRPAPPQDLDYARPSVSRETDPPTYSTELEFFSHLGTPSPKTGFPPGAGASRLIHGTHPAHLAVENFVAEWLGLPAALLFASGYAANVGALGALLGPEDLVVSDALNHASLIDGIRLSRARVEVVPHLDLKATVAALEKPCTGAKWVVVESYYSMDGDGPDLRELRRICDEAGACLYVDEAHSIGVFGPQGAGLCAEAGITPDALVAAFGKAVGSQGAVVAGSHDLRTWLWNRGRSFVFSTAPSPLHSAHLFEQLLLTRSAENERARLALSVMELRRRLRAGNAPLIPGSFGPIIGLVLGTEDRALGVAERLRSVGILTQAIRPPTVPNGESRLRVTISASWDTNQVRRLASELLVALSAT